MINAKLLQLVIDASDDGIVVAEQEGEDNILIYANPAFERMTGYSGAEILYRDCRFLQNGEADPQVLKVLRQAIDQGKPARQILRNYRKDGTSFWNELSITPVYNEADQLMYYVGIQKDVSEQVAAQQRIGELERQLQAAHEDIRRLQGDERR
ncbi:PAS domain-containing protein [Pseudomonas sp. HR96]|uniref:PAS domain-containing protein n=1 Tax=Pseudomonas sp. HR96 TaxID=1027966 RepID=UPI002A7577AE|nr:PAS domain-containing protein [Pseudomonas sp. HR96]WPP00714.1 PAS domain-containing protein [Pseudomonas sp. HR96]